MADSVKFQRFILKMQSPWNLPGQTEHIWHNKFSVSGSISMTQEDAEATALDLWQPIAGLTSSKTSLVGFSYYESGNKVATYAVPYAAGTHNGTLGGYTTNADPGCQLEVCALARNPVGVNSLGKEVYLRKWIHDVLSTPSDPNALAPRTNDSLLLSQWNHGSGPHAVVPIDPTSGDQGPGWQLETHLYTHQLRRGPRRKKASTDGLSVSDALQDLAALRSLISKIPVE
jgi:hypothetical protein